jgi:tetratricopeptide (TPR) repeat protein
MDALFEIPTDILSLAGRDDAIAGIDIRRAVFLDTETTGLAGGTGTVPFLTGIGTFTDSHFRIEQFFMRDYDEERATLAAVRDRLEGAEMLVTYNGKAFDLNLLAARFTLSRMRLKAVELPHLDLLFTARRLWKRRLGDCSLSNIERRVLAFEREDDVPGFLIPGLYFDYLRTRDAGRIAPVFRHNVWDILTLAALATVSGRIYGNPRETLEHPLDWISLGRTFESLCRWNEAADCFRRTLDFSLETDVRDEALLRLGFTLKRSGDWEKMIGVWEHMTKRAPHQIRSFEELAKYHEHRSGRLDEALSVVERALAQVELMESLRPAMGLEETRIELNRRLARLKKKLGRAIQKRTADNAD